MRGSLGEREKRLESAGTEACSKTNCVFIVIDCVFVVIGCEGIFYGSTAELQSCKALPLTKKEKPGMVKKSPEVCMKIFLIAIFICSVMAVSVAAQTYDAIIVGEGVRMRELPDLSAKILSILPRGKLVDLLDVTQERFRLNESYEYGYHWFKVSVRGGHEGWVYGEYVYLITEDILPPDWVSEAESGIQIKQSYIDTYFGDKEILNRIYTRYELKYKLNLGIEPSYPISDADGLTGSTIRALPFFYDIVEEKALPFIAYENEPAKVPGLEKLEFFCQRDHTWDTKDRGYWVRLRCDDGISEHLAKLQVVQEDEGMKLLVLKVTFNLQDGGGEYHLILFPEENCTEVECIYYTEQHMGEEIEKGVNQLKENK